ncbi:MAG: fibrobacter succinogenes major paralogous domain-containing protein [Fibromonadaceae bacterium]|jgi:uncharacterized protein (TIGR02145 family)|nr:fibrobacter succinogenes major paralogous domain-containing protein [Fibromonadaceae bacterium]
MNKTKSILRLAISIALALTFSCSGDDNGGGNSSDCTSSPNGGGNFEYGSLPYQGKTYKTVKIGNQVWTTENLNYKVEGSKCYENKDSNCTKYGRLYTWAAAMGINAKYNEEKWGGSDVKHQGICPDGWHIPSKANWDELISYVGNSSAGKHLKARSGWNECGNGLDTYSFSALPGGIGFSNGDFGYVGDIGIWNSASEYSSNDAHRKYIRYYSEYVDWGDGYKDYLLSVRCVKD